MSRDLDSIARRAARGDGGAFALLCQRLNDDVWRYCAAVLGDQELARDAAQETFVRLVTAIRRYRGGSGITPYVLTIARRCAAATLRERVRHRSDALAEEPPVADHAGAVDATLLLSPLPDELRQAFVLTQLLGLSYAEAARVCRCPVGTIRSRVHRARERLVAAATPNEEAADG